MSDLTTACMQFTGPQEGNILWPYRDNAAAGNATVGVGHMLSSPAYAAQIFGVSLDSILQPQWDDLMKAEAGKPAIFYETITDLRITPEKSEELFRSDVECHIANCQEYVPEFNELPQPVQITCQDIDLNVKDGIRKFPAMIRAISARDWAAVSRESNRPQLPARSQAVRDLLAPLLAPAVVT